MTHRPTAYKGTGAVLFGPLCTSTLHSQVSWPDNKPFSKDTGIVTVTATTATDSFSALLSHQGTQPQNTEGIWRYLTVDTKHHLNAREIP